VTLVRRTSAQSQDAPVAITDSMPAPIWKVGSFNNLPFSNVSQKCTKTMEISILRIPPNFTNFTNFFSL
jgi:hypothetical protein